MKKGSSLKRILAGLLCAAMVFQSMSVNTLAADMGDDIEVIASEESLVEEAAQSEVITEAASDVVATEGADDAADAKEETSEIAGISDEANALENAEAADAEGEEILAEGESGLVLGEIKGGYTSAEISVTSADSTYNVECYKKGDETTVYRNGNAIHSYTTTTTVSNLAPGKDYILKFYKGTGSDKELVDTKEFSTIAISADDITISIDKGTEKGQIKSSLALSEWKSDVANENGLYFWYKIINSDTKEVYKSDSSYLYRYNADVSVSVELEGLSSDAPYQVIWSYTDTDNEKAYEDTTVAVSPDKAEGSFDCTLTQDSENASKTNMEFTGGVDFSDGKQIYVWWKKSDETEWRGTTAYAHSSSEDISFTNYQGYELGCEYDIQIVIDGVSVDKKMTYTDSSYSIDFNEDIGIFDLVPNVTITAVNPDDTDTYSVYAICYKMNGESVDACDISMSKDGNTYSGSGKMCYLKPDTDYDVEYKVKKNGSSIGIIKRPIHSPNISDDAYFSITPSVSGGNFQIYLPSGISDPSFSPKNYYVYACLYKEVDGKLEHLNNYEYDFVNGAYETSGVINSLDEDTQYTVVLCDAYNNSLLSNTFTTLKDTRTAVVNEVEPLIGGIRIDATITDYSSTWNDVSDYKLAYRKKGTDNWNWSGLSYSSSAKYDKYCIYEINDITSLSGVVPGDEVEYRIGFTSKNNADKMSSVYSGSFIVPEDDRTLTVKEENVYADGLKIVADVDGTTSLSAYVKAFYRVEGDTDWIDEYNSISFGYYTNQYGKDLEILISPSASEAGKKYEYIIGITDSYFASVDELKAEKTGTFTVAGDERALGDVTCETSIYTATFTGAITGVPALKQYANIFYRVKGNTTGWACRNQDIAGESEFEIELLSLLEGTEYDYVVGIASTPSYSYYESMSEIPSDITIKKEGTFTTKEDPRTIKSVNKNEGYQKVAIAVDAEGFTEEIPSNSMYFWYRKKGDTGSYEYKISNYNDVKTSDHTFNYTIKNLDINTEYEYVVTFKYNSNNPDGFDDATKFKIIKKGSFKTKAATADYKLEGAALNALTTYSTGFVKVKLTNLGEKPDDTVNAILTLDSGNTTTVKLTRQKNYEETAVFTGLAANRTYKVTSAVFAAIEDGDTVPLNTFSGEIASFTTKSIVAADGIKLSKSEILLSVTGSGRGVYYENLIATVTPDNCTRGVVWTSSNPEVAAVDYSGCVTARGIGTATITATVATTAASENPLKAECKVTVKDYAVGYYDEDNAFVNFSNEWYENNPFHIYKGKTVSGWGLYEFDGEKYVSLADKMVVTPARKNIVEWDATKKELKGVAPGTTAVYFSDSDTKIKTSVYVTVMAEGKKFAIKGLNYYGDDSLKAIPNTVSDIPKEYDVPYAGYSTNYYPWGVISPDEYFEAWNFDWKSDKTDIVDTESYGALVVKGVGTAEITVTPKSDEVAAAYKDDVFKFKVNVKSLPDVDYPTIYVPTNIATKLSDIKFKDIEAFKDYDPEGWSWDKNEADTKLYSLPVNYEYYTFSAEYTGKKYFNYKTKVDVYLSTINKVVLEDSDMPEDKAGSTVSVVAADGSDAARLRGYVRSYGNTDGLDIKLALTASPSEGISLPKDPVDLDDIVPITATKEGTYTIKAVAKVGKDTVGETTYTIKAVKADKIVDAITFGSDNTSINKQINSGDVHFDINDEVKKFSISANVISKAGPNAATKLKWTSTDDKYVASVAASEDGHTAEVTILGSGHTVLKVEAEDESGYTAYISLEARDYKPRIEENAITVNTEIDYESYDGRYISKYTYGDIEIAGVYGQDIDWDNTKIVKADGSDSEFELDYMKDGSADLYYYIVKPKKDKKDVAAGKYNYTLKLKTVYNDKLVYDYPVNITVLNKQFKGKATSTAFNLFYLPNSGYLGVALDFYDGRANYQYSNGYINTDWEDKNNGTGNEFGITATWAGYNYSQKKTYIDYNVNQSNVKVVDGKPETGVDLGTLTINYPGIRKPIVIEAVKIKTKYKKAKVTAYNSSSTNAKGKILGKTTSGIVPALGMRSTYLYYYDSTLAKWLNCGDSYSNNYFNGAYSATPDMTLAVSGGTLKYVGNKNSEKTKIVLTSNNWRENVTCSHSVKVVTPVVDFAKNLTYNKKFTNGYAYSIRLKNVSGSYYFSDVEVEGLGNAKEYLDSDKLQVYKVDGRNAIMIRQNDLKVLGSDIPNGKYKFKLTPHITLEDGSDYVFNPITTTVNIVSQEPSVTTKAKGTLDILNQVETYYYKYKNTVKYTNTVKGLANYSRVSSAELVGEYSDYFKIEEVYQGFWLDDLLYSGHISIKEFGKLKAGQDYKLRLKYKVVMNDGEEVELLSNEFVVKTKQPVFKFKAAMGKRQNFFAATNGMYRTVGISKKYSSGEQYSVYRVYGELDVNKDGNPDVVVEPAYGYGSNCYINARVTIRDKDALLAGGKNGKGVKYSIPVTVYINGRDGISKDSTATVKINVKR